MIKKFLEAEVRAVNQEEGTFEILASSGKTDRLGDKIDPKGWYLKNYKTNPVILWSHSTGGLFGGVAIPPVAKAEKVWIENDKELKIKGKWADTPFAQELRTLVEGGFLNAVSVGFLPLVENEKGNIKIDGKAYRRATDDEIKKGMYDSEYGEKFTKQELLEVSWVSVPALPQALVSARKMNLALVTKALEEEIREKPEAKETETYQKPYPNEHSCRLESPDKYKRFRRENCQRKHDGKCIDVIWGITKGEEEKTEQQALRYDKEVWTEASAKTHCKDEEGTFEAASKKEKETYNCECLDCEHKLTTEKHCVDVKCPKCGGKMRRVERPGAGKELTTEQFDKIRNFISETEKAISVLKGILPESDATPTNDKKGRIPEKKIKSQLKAKDKEAEIKLLRIADKAIEALLRKLRQNINEND